MSLLTSFVRGMMAGLCLCTAVAQNSENAPRTIRVPGESAEETLRALEARKERQILEKAGQEYKRRRH